MSQKPCLEYTCSAGHRFRTIGSDGYGEFVMRSEGLGTPAWLDALSDPVFEEVEVLLQEIPEYAALDETARADRHNYVFSTSVDRDSDGSVFLIGGRPRCPICSSREMSAWEFIQGGMDDDGVQMVGHSMWNSLSPAQKRDQVVTAFSRAKRT